MKQKLDMNTVQLESYPITGWWISYWLPLTAYVAEAWGAISEWERGRVTWRMVFPVDWLSSCQSPGACCGAATEKWYVLVTYVQASVLFQERSMGPRNFGQMSFRDLWADVNFGIRSLIVIQFRTICLGRWLHPFLKIPSSQSSMRISTVWVRCLEA